VAHGARRSRQVEPCSSTRWAERTGHSPLLHQWTLVHSPRPEILHAIERGDALLSHLDGEWWLSF